MTDSTRSAPTAPGHIRVSVDPRALHSLLSLVPLSATSRSLSAQCSTRAQFFGSVVRWFMGVNR